MSLAQASLFDKPAAAPVGLELWPHQAKACAAIEEKFAAGARSVLVVAATGCGKTTVFCEAIRRTPGRAMVLAHRGELLDQAIARVRRQLPGKTVSREQAGEFAWKGSDVVVASVQTLKGPRLERFRPDEFALVVVDEAHHAPAASYRAIMDWFTGAKILGVTATPDRADEQAMGAVFDEVAFVYEIDDAIRDGILCRIRATQVLCGDLDMANVATVAGDLNQGQLDAVMSAEKVLHQVVGPTLELAGNRRTIMFTTSVENAHRMAEVFNRHRPGCARAVDGESRDRAQVLADHQAGRYQFLCNVQVLTEGYDDPAVSCIGLARPTKSRALYAQMAGRGTRIAPGKEDLLLLDFMGNAGRHSLICATDILAGKHPDEVVARAKKKVADQPGKDIGQAIEEALAEIEEQKRREAARRAKLVARAQYQKREIDPFGAFGVKRSTETERRFDEPATEKQRERLTLWKMPVAADLTKREASKLISTAIKRREVGLCTWGQARTLERAGYDAKKMSFEQASRLIDALARNRWRRVDETAYAAAMGKADAGAEG